MVSARSLASIFLAFLVAFSNTTLKSPDFLLYDRARPHPNRSCLIQVAIMSCGFSQMLARPAAKCLA